MQDTPLGDPTESVSTHTSNEVLHRGLVKDFLFIAAILLYCEAILAVISLSSSPSSGNRSKSFLENTNSSPTVTSKTPPDAGTNANSVIDGKCLVRISTASRAAFGK